MNHQAVPQMTPANTQPLSAPKPEQPRTAQAMPPNAANSRVGRNRSLAQLRAVGLVDKQAKCSRVFPAINTLPAVPDVKEHKCFEHRADALFGHYLADYRHTVSWLREPCR